MQRNLDLVSLRTLVAVAESGGMTRAANMLHMTQSAVSMQMKRLEDQLSVQLLKRDGRKIVTTVEGDRLVSYARRLLELNTEALRSLTEPTYDLSINCGVSGDIMNPFLPRILARLRERYPRLGINLACDFSYFLRRGLKNGLYDVILTTEREPAEGGLALAHQNLVWMTKPNGLCWQTRPLPIAISHNCIFRKTAFEALENSNVKWVDVVQSMRDESAQAHAAADLGVRVELPCCNFHGIEAIDHEGALPELPDYCITAYFSSGLNREIASEFSTIAKHVFKSEIVC